MSELRAELIRHSREIEQQKKIDKAAAQAAAKVEETRKEHNLFKVAVENFEKLARRNADEGRFECIPIVALENSPAEMNALRRVKEHFDFEGYTSWTSPRTTLINGVRQIQLTISWKTNT